MRAPFAAIAAIIALGLVTLGSGRATLDTVSSAQPSMEVLVFEHPDCTYCEVFRARVAPQYRLSPHAADAPLRFVDVSRTGTELATLKAPISMVPTAVVMKNGREVDRVAGYWGPANSLRMLAFIIDRAE